MLDIFLIDFPLRFYGCQLFETLQDDEATRVAADY